MVFRLKSAMTVSNPMLKFRSFFQDIQIFIDKNAYVYSRQKLGIYIRLSVYIKQRGAVTMNKQWL